MFKIVNRQTGQTVATRNTRNAAIKEMDRRDTEHGSYIHYIKEPAAMCQFVAPENMVD